MSVKLYVGSLIAMCKDPSGDVVSVARTVVLFKESEEAAHNEAHDILQKDFPESQGWRDTQVAIYEVFQGIVDNGYRLTWNLEPVS